MVMNDDDNDDDDEHDIVLEKGRGWHDDVWIDDDMWWTNEFLPLLDAETGEQCVIALTRF